jgi:methylmalonyl-CoA decarboxylase subunit alpha
MFDSGDDPTRLLPDLAALMPSEPNKPYDIRDVIARVFDSGDYFEVQSLFARNILTCFARLGGRSVGIVANQPKSMAGVLDINASDKAAASCSSPGSFRITSVVSNAAHPSQGFNTPVWGHIDRNY